MEPLGILLKPFHSQLLIDLLDNVKKNGYAKHMIMRATNEEHKFEKVETFVYLGVMMDKEESKHTRCMGNWWWWTKT